MKTLSLLFTIFTSLAYSQKSSADLIWKMTNSQELLNYERTGGSEGTGGGDLCEVRIKAIRDDIKSWILKGGAEFLVLPAGIDNNRYVDKMLEVISKAKVNCVGPGDQEYPIQVNGTPKFCKFKKNAMSITCDIGKFSSLDESNQYLLVHHEYAGLADLENPNGDDSNYEISNQITNSLVNTIVKRLAVKSKTPLTLKVGTLVPAHPGETYVLGQKIYVTQQAYGLTVNGRVAYGEVLHSWYAVTDDSMPEGANIYLAKGNLQVVYGRGVNGHQGLLCEYPIQVKLTEMGTSSFLATYQFPLAVATSIALPGGTCPVVNTNTLWSSSNIYTLIQQ